MKKVNAVIIAGVFFFGMAVISFRPMSGYAEEMGNSKAEEMGNSKEVKISTEKRISKKRKPARKAAVKKRVKKNIYTCPMHPEVTSDKPGNCSKCGMALEKK